MQDPEGGVALLPESLTVDRAAVEKACKAAQALLHRPERDAPRRARRRISQPAATAMIQPALIKPAAIP
ncbi:MAG: hypothetical protein H6713_09210 [Myxococcales bacterium]|nr:hypothetical protein [Myxococcales bacterium]MCB9750166.1 hypothetical protein [Myxococcales bacterium]